MAHWIDRVSAFRVARRAALLLFAGIVCVSVATGRMPAQAAAPDTPVTTLRVYENLIQIPVVVLGPMMELMKPVLAKRFYVSLDSGPPFQATHIRFEDDDPIALSVLIDLDSDQGGVANELGKAIERLGTASLRGEDRVSIYALRRCQVWRAVYDAVPDLPSLGRQVAGLKEDGNGGAERKGNAECRHRLLLLDALGRVLNQISTLPGRRVVLVVSDGEDKRASTVGRRSALRPRPQEWPSLDCNMGDVTQTALCRCWAGA